ncbi:homeobox domain protein [Ostertagia ostertagi]
MEVELVTTTSRARPGPRLVPIGKGAELKETEFCTSTFVTSERKAELSTLLNLTERQIKIWFQNRRAKDRRDKHKKS